MLRSSSRQDRKSTRLNSSHSQISYAVFCLKKKKYLGCQTIISANNCGMAGVGSTFFLSWLTNTRSYSSFSTYSTTQISTLSLHDALPIFPSRDKRSVAVLLASCPWVFSMFQGLRQ